MYIVQFASILPHLSRLRLYQLQSLSFLGVAVAEKYGDRITDPGHSGIHHVDITIRI